MSRAGYLPLLIASIAPLPRRRSNLAPAVKYSLNAPDATGGSGASRVSHRWLTSGQSISLTLQSNDASLAGITYTARVLAGPQGR
jgi:hypothetical protein